MAVTHQSSKQKGIGHLQLVKQIAQGGMSTVWKVLHPSHDIPLVLKVTAFRSEEEYQYQEQFDQELLALARLDHPNVIRLLDFGRISKEDAKGTNFLENNSWLLFEYVKGQPIVPQCQESDWLFIRRMIIQLLEALAHIHARGIVHRDVCPGNVFWSERDRCLKLIDFGIAWQKDLSIDQFSGYGSYGFSAPEVMTGGDIGPWSDLYSAGYLFALMLSELDKLPLALSDWLLRLTNQDVSRRFQRAADALYAFANIPVSFSQGTGVQNLFPAVASVTNIAITETITVSFDDDLEEEIKETIPLEIDDTKQYIPPFLNDWRTSQKPRVALNWAVPSISLFPLRLPPMKGREEEQDWLWRHLRAVVQNKQSSVISLQGEKGLGISRLLLWFGHRVHETGIGDVHYSSPEEIDLEEIKKASKLRVQLVLFDSTPDKWFSYLPELDCPVLFVIGRAKIWRDLDPLKTKTLQPLSKKNWFALLSSFAKLDPFPASWIALQAKGHPGKTKDLLLSLLEDKMITQGYGCLVWAKKPEPPTFALETISAYLENIDDDIFEGMEAVNLYTLDCLKVFLQGYPIQQVAQSFYQVWDKLCRIALALENFELMRSLLQETQFFPHISENYLFEAKRKTIRIYQRLNQFEKADQINEEILSSITDSNSREYLLAYWEYAYQAYLQGRYQIAHERYQVIYEKSKEIQQPKMAAHSIGGMAFSLGFLGHFSSSLQLLEEAQRRASESKIDFTLASIQELYCVNYLGLAKLEDAKKSILQAFKIHREQGKYKPINSTMLWLQVEHQLKNREQVVEILEELNHRLEDVEKDIQGYIYLYYFIYGSDEMVKQHYVEKHLEMIQEHPSVDPLLGVLYTEAIKTTNNDKVRRSLIQAYNEFWDRLGWDIAERWRCQPFELE